MGEVLYSTPAVQKAGAYALESHLAALWAILTYSLLNAFPQIGLVLILLARTSTLAFWVVIICYSTLLLPRCKHSDAVVEVLDTICFQWWRRYTAYKVSYPKGFPVEQQVIMATWPHGVFPLGGQMHASVFKRIHGSSMKVLTANVLFCVPLWRHYMSACGCMPATRATFRACLEAGRSVSVHVGGIAEMFVGEKDREVIVLGRRRGFVAMAVETGVPIAPCFHFGNSRLLDFGPKWLANLSRKLRMSIGFAHGRFGLPVPRQMPVWTVVGDLIDAGPGMSPEDPAFAAKVDEVHHKVTEAIKQLYDTHRGEYFDGRTSWKDRPLVVL